MQPPGLRPDPRRPFQPPTRPPSLLRLVLRLVLVIGAIVLLLRFSGRL
jgi:hypothetical protein